MSHPTRAAIHLALWLILGGWLGALALFGGVVIPAAFRVLPSGDLAGNIVGAVLPRLEFFGIGAGIALAGVGAMLHRGRVIIGLSLSLSIVCALSHFGITAPLEEVGNRAFGASADTAAQAEFAHLHKLSVLLFFATALGVFALAVLHASQDLAVERREKSARFP